MFGTSFADSEQVRISGIGRLEIWYRCRCTGIRRVSASAPLSFRGRPVMGYCRCNGKCNWTYGSVTLDRRQKQAHLCARDPSSSRRRWLSVSWSRATCSCQTWRGCERYRPISPARGVGVRVARLGLAQAGVCQASAVCLRCSWLVRKYSIGRVTAVTPTPTHHPRRSSALALNQSAFGPRRDAA